MNMKVAYVLHRFPYLTETFIMREIYWLRQIGVDVQIFSLLPPKHQVVHDQARELLAYTKYSPFISWNILRAPSLLCVASPFTFDSGAGQSVLADVLGTDAADAAVCCCFLKACILLDWLRQPTSSTCTRTLFGSTGFRQELLPTWSICPTQFTPMLSACFVGIPRR